MKHLMPALVCLAIFHTPDGTPLTIDTAITAIRVVDHIGRGTHVARGTHSVIYAGGQKFGVSETQEEARAILKACKD